MFLGEAKFEVIMFQIFLWSYILEVSKEMGNFKTLSLCVITELLYTWSQLD